MLTIAPDSMDAIAQAGLPSARTRLLIMLDAMNTGKNPRIILKYSTA